MADAYGVGRTHLLSAICLAALTVPMWLVFIGANQNLGLCFATAAISGAIQVRIGGVGGFLLIFFWHTCVLEPLSFSRLLILPLSSYGRVCRYPDP